MHTITTAVLTATLAAVIFAACTTSAPAPTPTAVPTQAALPTRAPTATVPPNATPYPTSTPFVIRVPDHTPTAVPTPSHTPTLTPTAAVPAPTRTPTPAPTITPVPAPTAQPTATAESTQPAGPTATVTPTQAPTATSTATQTPSPSPTNTPTNTPTLTPTATPTATPTPSPSPTPTPEPNYPPEQAALIALYDATGGANWTVNTNWRTDAPIGSWHGVTADADGSVIELDLTYNDLTGHIPNAIGQLTELQRLSLSTNQLSGTIPTEIGNLTRLTYLDFSSNELQGAIPPQLGSLTNLTELLLHFNQLSGNIPTELGNMSSMGSMDLQGNQLTGIIPPQLARMDGLYGLYVAGNMLEGNIPATLSTLPYLAYLDVSNNRMSGDTSDWPTNLNTLSIFRISDNDFNGCVPADMKNVIESDVIFSRLSYCGDPAKQEPVSPDFVTWRVGDAVAASEERAARISFKWLYDYAISVGWPIAGDPITIYLDDDLGLAQILAESDGTVEPGEIDVHLGFIRSTGGFADDDANYTRASSPGTPVSHGKTVDAIVHENLHTMFQRDLAGLNTNRHGEWGAPLWWTEGMAKLITTIVISNQGTAFPERRQHLVQAADVERCNVPLADLEDPATYDLFLCGYDVGALAVELLGSIVGFQNLVKIYTERTEGSTWHQTFNQAFNLSITDFYTQFTQHRQASYPPVPHPRHRP